MTLTFSGLPTSVVRDIKTSGRDSNGQEIEHHISDGSAAPCRHCFGATPKGATYHILGHRPFEKLNAYAETGPIFLCKDDCAPCSLVDDLPATLDSPTYMVKGYTGDDRIKYGTGKVVAKDDILQSARAILDDPNIAFVDVRSAMNNCWHGRITRTG